MTLNPPALENVRAFAKGTSFHADVVEPLPVIPKNLKALPDLSAMVIEYGKHMRARSDEAFFEPIQEEIERLQNCEYDLGEIMEKEHLARWALSFPSVKAALAECGPQAVAAVEELFAALAEVK